MTGVHRQETVVFSQEGTDEAGTGWTGLGLVSLANPVRGSSHSQLQISEYQECRNIYIYI